MKWMLSHSVVSDSLRPHGLWPTRLLHPRGSPGKNTGVGCHDFLLGIFLTQESNLRLLHCRQILYPLNHLGSPIKRKYQTLIQNFIQWKKPLAKQGTRVLSLGWDYPLEKKMVTHSSDLAWRIPWAEEPGGYSPWGLKESDTTELTKHTHTQ